MDTQENEIIQTALKECDFSEDNLVEKIQTLIDSKQANWCASTQQFSEGLIIGIEAILTLLFVEENENEND